THEFDQLLAKDLPALNESLKTKGQQPISAPPVGVGATEVTNDSGGTIGGGRLRLPADFRISY
ncbi:MAG: hypothetical protein J2P56_06480, partial [Verrucomicrobia bacterium]|nr:hypothetical protein [Verrucomicrobiota bacterium]